MGIFKWIRDHFAVVEEDVVSLPQFRLDKTYSEMNRSERREYRRWLSKHDMWDGDVVLDNMERGSLFNDDID